jgi:hypothetical protein
LQKKCGLKITSTQSNKNNHTTQSFTFDQEYAYYSTTFSECNNDFSLYWKKNSQKMPLFSQLVSQSENIISHLRHQCQGIQPSVLQITYKEKKKVVFHQNNYAIKCH